MVVTRRDSVSAPGVLGAVLGAALCLVTVTAGPASASASAPAPSPAAAGHVRVSGPVRPPGLVRPASLARPADSTDDPDPNDPDGSSDDDGPDGSDNAGGSDRDGDGPAPDDSAHGESGERNQSGERNGLGERAETPSPTDSARPTGAARPSAPATTHAPTTTRARAAERPPAAVHTPATTDPCPLPAAPPKAIDASERPTPGEAAPAPLPVPAQPVGGPRMGECGNVVPPGAPPPPSVSDAASWVLADLDTGAVLAARSPHARERPASCLKVLTALVALNRLDLNTVVDGTEADADADGSRVGVGPGGKYTVRQLLTGLILNSGNDAANALARTLGGIPATLHDMTEQADQLGATDTRPATPSGLDAPGMSTSAYDLALVYRAVIRNPTFAEVSKTRLYNWPGRGNLPGFEISNQNEMLTEYPGTFGGKTGFTDDARHTRITAAERHGRRLVLVQMRSENHPVTTDQQAVRLLDYGFSLPANTPPVGQLVNGPVPTTTPAPPPTEAAGPATGPLPAEADPANRYKALATIGGGAVLGALLSVLIARRRSRPQGRHSTRPGST